MSSFIAKTADEKARRYILENINSNIFVEAGAGSGKTTMLVNRMVAMIESGIPVEKICAITFTKNAALEFYERFQAKLIERTNPALDKPIENAGDLDIPSDQARERCKRALENIDLCFMGTIDSFCNMILSEHPTEAGIPSNTRLISDAEANALYRKFYVDVRKGLYNNRELETLSERFAMFFRNPEEMFASLIGEILNRRNVNFIYNDNLCIDFYKCFSKQREDIRKVLNKFAQDQSRITSSEKKEAQDIIEYFNDANNTIQKGWEYNYSGVQYALKKIQNIKYSGSCDELGFTNESVVRDTDGATFITLNIADSETKDALLLKLDDYKYQNTLKFLLGCVEPLSKLMKEEGKLSFFDYLLYLRDMLVDDSKKDGKLIEYIYNRHSYFLIDEFQDTNPMQAEVFFYLAAKDPKQSSWKNCKPKDGSLFIVGDPKQSIYRFRSADVASYTGIRKLFEENKENCAVKYLVNNFRSKNVVKTFFNDVFNEVLCDDDDPEQSKYKDIENLNNSENDSEFKGIYKYQCYTGALLSENKDMSDSEQIAKVILSLMNSDKKILDTDKQSKTYKELRNIRFSDFMVIFYNKKKIPLCINTFNKYNIPSKVEGKVLFEESLALKTITSIYKAVTTPDDTISLVEALKSPVFSYNDNDLSQFKKNNNDIRLSSTNNQDSGIGNALKTLTETAKCISKHTPTSLFEMIIDEYEIFKYVSSDNLEIVYYALELIRGEEKNGNIITFEDTINYLNELISGESAQERCLSLKQGIDAVHIANLHKVKGLEAPIVILAQSGVNNNPKAGIRIEYRDDPDTNRTISEGYVCSISDPNSAMFNAIETKSLSEISDKEKNSLKKEVKRLVYVAATRARNVLIINDSLQRRGKKDSAIKSYPKSNQWGSLLEHCDSNIFDVVNENPGIIGKIVKEKHAADLYKNVTTINMESDKSYELVKPSETHTQPRTAEMPTFEDTEIVNDGKLLGTIVHRLMEMIIMSGDNIQKEEAVNNILDEYVTSEFIERKNSYRETLNKVYERMHNGGYPQINGVSQDILKEILSAQTSYSEVPFSYRVGNKVWNGIIDVLYIKDNKAYIIDWKTNKDDSNLSNQYKEQLDAYKSATRQIIGIEVESALIYHIDLTE